MRKPLLGFAALALALAMSGPASANLVVNGGFETGDFTGWTLSGNPGFISITSNPAEVHSGTFAARFGAVGSPTFLTQTQDLATVAGQSYTLDFWLQNLGGPVNHFRATVAGVDLVTIDNANPFPYTEFTRTFVATSSSTMLQFAFQQNPSFWDFDDVSVNPLTTAAPEPSTLVSGGVAGLLGLAYAWRRRKRRAA